MAGWVGSDPLWYVGGVGCGCGVRPLGWAAGVVGAGADPLGWAAGVAGAGTDLLAGRQVWQVRGQPPCLGGGKRLGLYYDAAAALPGGVQCAGGEGVYAAVDIQEEVPAAAGRLLAAYDTDADAGREKPS